MASIIDPRALEAHLRELLQTNIGEAIDALVEKRREEVAAEVEMLIRRETALVALTIKKDFNVFCDRDELLIRVRMTGAGK